MKDTKYKNYQYEKVFINKGKLYARLYNKNTNKSEIIDLAYGYIPELYIEEDLYQSYANKLPHYFSKCHTIPSNKKSFINGKLLRQINFNRASEVNEFIEYDEDNLYGYNNRAHNFIRKHFPNPLESNHDFHIWYLDIETRSGIAEPGKFPDPYKALEEVSVIQIYDNKDDTYYVFGVKDFTGTFEKTNTVYKNVGTERNLLLLFLKLIELKNPTAILTVNGLGFDYPYLTNRIKKLGMDYTKLSPVGVINEKNYKTQDGIAGITYEWEGRYLLDLRELFLKYSYANLPNTSLDAMAKWCDLEGKVDHSNYSTFDGFYSGEGYIFPRKITSELENDLVYKAQLEYKNNPTLENKLKVEQTTFNRFIEYSIRDVELMVGIEDKKHFLDVTKVIAYTCGVNINEVMGTLKQWKSFVYNECYKNDIIIPVKQKYSDENVVYRAGWTRSIPGRHEWVASFDFTSLYPSLFQAFNIGTDTMIKPEELPEELKNLQKEYFTFFNKQKEYELNIKYKGETNDVTEESQYYQYLLDNKDNITPILKKYNVSATPNGYFFRRDIESVSSVLMRRIFNDRIKHKQKSQELYGELEDIKRELNKRELKF